MSAVRPETWSLSEERRSALSRRAQTLAAMSVAYNVIEAIIAISAGMVAGSVALIGFGLDSVVEVSSGLIILWQFRHKMPETRERQALRLMALSFFALAGYVGFESVRALLTQSGPDTSIVGIVLAAVSLAIMPFLSWAQRRTGRALNSNAVVADSTQTLLCTYLSAVLLIGLVVNASLGWYWADPIAGLIIAAVAVKEGREAWRGEGCCAPAAGFTGGLPGGAVAARVVTAVTPAVRHRPRSRRPPVPVRSASSRPSARHLRRHRAGAPRRSGTSGSVEGAVAGIVVPAPLDRERHLISIRQARRHQR